MSVHPVPKDYRRKGLIDTTGLKYPKFHPSRDAKYRQYVRNNGPCILPNVNAPCGTKPDRGSVECAHLPASGQRGFGFKVSDAACVPLCPVHHDLLDGQVLPWQIVAFLWMRALFIREAWWRGERGR